MMELVVLLASIVDSFRGRNPTGRDQGIRTRFYSYGLDVGLKGKLLSLNVGKGWTSGLDQTSNVYKCFLVRVGQTTVSGLSREPLYGHPVIGYIAG